LNTARRERLKLAAAEGVAMTDPRLQRLAVQIHTLGPRPLYELLREIDAGAELGPTLERYARLAPLAEFIAAHGGDDFRPLRVVGGRR
jgi:hypothetical protein